MKLFRINAESTGLSTHTHEQKYQNFLDVCMTVHYLYYDVSNQRDPTTFSFIRLFKISPTCFRPQIRPSSGTLFNSIYSFWYNAPTLLPVGSSVGALYQKLYIHSKRAPEDGRICPPKHVGGVLKRLINEKDFASRWLLTS